MILNQYGLLGPGLGKRSTAQVSAPAAAGGGLPNEDDIIMWYDFGDTTTMWQEIARTNPSDAHGDDIVVIEDKGSRGYDLQNNTFPLVLDLTSETWGSTNGVIGNVGRASMVATVPMPVTVFQVLTVSDIATLGIATQIGNDAYYQTRTNKNQAHQIYTGNTPINGTLDVPHHTWYASIMVLRTNSTQEVWNSVDAASATGARPSTTWPTTAQVIMGANTSGNSNAHVGKIAECIFYEIDDSGSIVADLKAYAETKYGITWAT
jgi:hypothetical protein